MLAVSHDEVFTAAIAGTALIAVAVIQNVATLRGTRGNRQKIEEGHETAKAWREEVRSDIRGVESRLTILNAKLDALLTDEDEHANGHLENGGEHG